MKSVPGKGTELVTTDAGEFVRKLKAQPGKDIIVMSGGNFATSLLQAGVIDEIGLTSIRCCSARACRLFWIRALV